MAGERRRITLALDLANPSNWDCILQCLSEESFRNGEIRVRKIFPKSHCVTASSVVVFAPSARFSQVRGNQGIIAL